MAVKPFRMNVPVAISDLTINSGTTEATADASPSITSGSGAPSASENNGSLYLRTGASADLYKRVGGAWSAIGAATTSTGLTFTVNSDASAASDEDPILFLMGGDGVAAPNDDVVTSTLYQDSSGESVAFWMQRDRNGGGNAYISPILRVGHPADTTASLDSSIVFHGVNDAGDTNNTASILFQGQEDELVLGTGATKVSTAVALDIDAGVTVSGNELAFSSQNLNLQGTSELIYSRWLQAIVAVTDATGGSTDATVDVDIQTLNGSNVAAAKAVRVRFYDASRNVLDGTASTLTLAATTGTIVDEPGTGDHWAECLTDASGNLTLTVSNSSDETIYCTVESSGNAASVGQGCIIAECVEQTIEWAA